MLTLGPLKAHMLVFVTQMVSTCTVCRVRKCVYMYIDVNKTWLKCQGLRSPDKQTSVLCHLLLQPSGLRDSHYYATKTRRKFEEHVHFLKSFENQKEVLCTCMALTLHACVKFMDTTVTPSLLVLLPPSLTPAYLSSCLTLPSPPPPSAIARPGQ